MKRKKVFSLVLALFFCAVMAGCDSTAEVYVQSVEVLANMGGIAPGDRFAGIVVSENVTQIKKDSDKTIKELLVKEGDDVQEGQVLFSYDTEELQLTLDKQKLELEQLSASIESYQNQITILENERNTVGEASRLKYTLEIQTAQIDMKEAEIKRTAKEKEIAQSEDLLANAEVVSPINGRIQKISESNENQSDQEAAYITIQQMGSYRIKGVLGELQRGGIVEGDRLTIFSRTDDSVSWSGTVTLVDYENPSQGSQQDMYYGNATDEMTAASKYPFYVELDDTDGLMLGQHVYLERELEEGQIAGIGISSAFLCYDESGAAYVWADSHGKLEKRMVTLGEYNPMTDVQEVTEGLTYEDYIAFPDADLCQEGVSTTRQMPEISQQAEEGEVA